MSSMSFCFTPLRWNDAQAVVRWRYSGIYAMYDQEALTMLTMALFRVPLRALGVEAFIVRDGAGERVGLFTFIRRGDSVEVGLAMRPDLTGRGLGLGFVEAGLDFARSRYAPARFTLDVATFNARAQRVYERAGFKPGETFIRHARNGPCEYLAMSRPA